MVQARQQQHDLSGYPLCSWMELEVPKLPLSLEMVAAQASDLCAVVDSLIDLSDSNSGGTTVGDARTARMAENNVTLRHFTTTRCTRSRSPIAATQWKF